MTVTGTALRFMFVVQICFSKQSGNVKTDYQYYTQNAHGDVVDLTDADGEIVKLYIYDVFGVEKILTMKI